MEEPQSAAMMASSAASSLGVNHITLAHALLCLQRLERMFTVLQTALQEAVIGLFGQQRQQGLQRRHDIAHHTQIHWMAAAQVHDFLVHLDDARLVRVEL